MTVYNTWTGTLDTVSMGASIVCRCVGGYVGMWVCIVCVYVGMYVCQWDPRPLQPYQTSSS